MKVPRRSDKLKEPEPEAEKLREPGYMRRHQNKIVGLAIGIGIVVLVFSGVSYEVGTLENHHAQIDQKLQMQLVAAGYNLEHVGKDGVSCSNNVRVDANVFIQGLAKGNNVILIAGGPDNSETDYVQINGGSCLTTWVDGYTSL